MLLKLLPQIIHRSHISIQNRLNYSLLDNTGFGWFELSTQEVIVAIFKKSEGLGGMVVFLDCVITKQMVKHGLSYFMVIVVESIVLDVMAEC